MKLNKIHNGKRSGQWQVTFALCCFALVTALLGLSAASGFAQTTSGNIVGTLTDSSGSLVPQTPVTLTNVATSTKNDAVTDASGYYQFVNVQPGNYKVTVSKQGFKQLSNGPFQVQVEGSLRINLMLEVGSENQTVTVTAESPMIQAETTSLGSVVSERETTEIPLNGRNPMSLTALVPSVVPQGGSTSNANGQNPFSWGNYQIGGGMAGQSATYIDGAPVNTGYINLTALIPTQDSLGEFKVDTNNLSAEYGHLAGGAIQFSTKSGTNNLHGAAWEYLRNKVLNANDFFSNRAHTPRGAFTQNQYGFNIGGPVYFPHMYDGRNKTFFFADWEGFALRKGQNFTQTVPTAAERAGDLSSLGISIYDPKTTCLVTTGCANGLPYGGRQLIPGANVNNAPSSTVSQTALNYLNAFYPQPNTAGTNGLNNFSRNASTGGNNYETVARVDHQFSDKQHLSVRYTNWTNKNLAIDPLGTGICQDRCGEDFKVHNFVIDDTYAINNTTILDIRLSYLRFVYNRGALLKSFSFASLSPAWKQLSAGVQFPGPPVFSIQGFDTANTFGSAGADSTIKNVSDNDRIAGNLVKMLGKHTLKFGGEFVRGTYNYGQANQTAGNFTFNSGFTTQNANSGGASGLGLASFLLGYPSGGSFNALKLVAAEQLYPALFVTDDWRLTPKATLHLGGRWEEDHPWTERHDNLSYFDTKAVNPLLQAAGLTNYVGSVEVPNSSTRKQRTVQNVNSKQFSPRLGLTYAVSPNTVVSAGYGILWIPSDVGFASSPNNDPINTFSTPYTASTNSGFTPAGSIDNPIPGGIIPAPGRDPSFQKILLGTGVSEVFPNNPWAYAQQWNLGVQQQFGGSFVMDIAYAGAKGTHLPFYQLPQNALQSQYFSKGATALQAQVPNPFFGIINPNYGLGARTIPAYQLLLKYPQYAGVSIAAANQAGSSYNSLQVKAQKRFSGGASIGAGYTYSKLISNTDTLTAWVEPSIAGAYGSFVDPNQPKLEKSLSSNDLRQRLVVDYVYDLPVGHGKKILRDAPRLVDAVVGGWGVEGITTLQSGFPLGFGVNNNLNGFYGGGQRPNYNAGCQKTVSGSAVKRLNEWFNTSCFTQPAQFTFGNESRNDSTLTSPGIANWDSSVFKNLAVDKNEKLNLQFRAEFFNLFNRVQFGYPNTSQGASNFGVVSSQLNTPRLVQFALRLKY